MLTLIIPGDEWFDEVNETFDTKDDVTLELEHSLLSLSKWESKFEKPFLSPEKKSTFETISYVKCMVLSPEISEEVFQRLTFENFSTINDYVDAKQSATTFRETREPSGRKEIVTAELIYYWMVAYQIPFECETWHLNRLFSLIRICNIKNSKPHKMSRGEIAAKNRELNAQRKAQLGTTG